MNEFIADRQALCRVPSLSTELVDITEVEYRKLRLERVVLVGVWISGSYQTAQEKLEELAALADTAGAQVLAGVVQRRVQPDPSTYIGSGKIAELVDLVRTHQADTVICDGELSPTQLTILEQKLNVKVIDRTALILDIFAQHAASKAGKVQIQLAQLEYFLPRLRGWGKALSRQAGGRVGNNGGVGLRGPGETKIEIDRRRIRNQIAKLKREIKQIKKNQTIKNNLRRSSNTKTVTIAGYTNSGKSSLLKCLTGENLFIQDALFATLDPMSRKVKLINNQLAIFTDTVGFVSNLPTQLVESFRSTIEEVANADLILHIVDISSSFPQMQIDTVNRIFTDLFSEAKAYPKQILVFNKIDLINSAKILEFKINYPEAQFISTRSGAGIQGLIKIVADFLLEPSEEIQVRIPFQRGDLITKIYEQSRVISVENELTGTKMKLKIPVNLLQELNEYIL